MSEEQFEKPSMWERFKIGVKGFTSHALGYIPRGVALTGAIFAGSTLLEGMFPGTGFLGISKMSTPDVITYGLRHLAFGSVISGTIGAGSDVYTACSCPTTAEGLAASIPSGTAVASNGHNLTKSVAETCVTAATEHIFTGHGLASAAKAAKHIGL